MLFYFDFDNYFRMIRLASRERSAAVRLYFLAALTICRPSQM